VPSFTGGFAGPKTTPFAKADTERAIAAKVKINLFILFFFLFKIG
jgi:hypothetical protein